MQKEPHRMRVAELRSMKEELERQLHAAPDSPRSAELRQKIEELTAEMTRRSRIGGPARRPSDRDEDS